MKNRSIPAAVAIAATVAAGTASAEEWSWSFAPYVWATDVGVDIAVYDRSLVDTAIAFEDLVEDLDSAALFRVEGMHGTHGLALDVFSVAVADDGGRMPLPGDPGSELALDASVAMTIVDLTGIYEFGSSATGRPALLYGTRVVHQREDVTAWLVADGAAGPAAQLESSDTFVDGLLGFRYDHALSDRWSYRVAADVSTGGTEFTWSVNPSVAYSFGDEFQYALTAGYRYMAIDFDTDPAIDNDMSLSGFVVGLRFGF